MGSPSTFFGSLLGEVSSSLEKQQERERALDLMGRKAELEHWGNLLAKPERFAGGEGGQPYADYLNRYFDVLGAMTGKKADRKKLQPAQDFIRSVMDKVYEGGQARPPIPAQRVELPPVPGGEVGSGEPGAPPRIAAAPGTPPASVSRIVLPEVPGVPERRGPFLTQEEMAQRNIRQSGEKVEVEETARRRAAAPFVKQAADIEHQNRLAEIRAQQEGRIIRGAPTPDPRPEAAPWDYVTPIYHGDGTTVFEPARRPAAIESAYQTAQAVAGRDRIPLTQAWDEVWRQGFETKEQQAQARAGAEVERTGRIERGNLQRQRLQQLLSRSSRGPQAGGLRPSEARAALAQIVTEVRARKAAYDPDDRLTDMPFEQAVMEVAKEWGLTSADVTRLRNISAGIVAAPATAPPRGSAAPTWEQYRQRRASQGR